LEADGIFAIFASESSVAEEVVGAWYADYPKSGSIYQGEDRDDLTYTRVVQYYKFEADGTGVWTEFLYDAGGKCVMQYGSMVGVDPDGAFTYTVAPDGLIQVTMLHNYADEMPKSWSLAYADGNSSGAETQHKKGIVSMPVVLPLIIKGMLDYSPELKDYRIEDFLSQQFFDTGIIDWLNSKDYSTDDIEKKLVELVDNGLTANGRTYTQNRWLRCWRSDTPATSSVHTGRHGARPTSCSPPRAMDAHAADEGKLFKVWDDAFSTSDHVDGGFTFFVNMGMMHNLAQQFQWLTE